MSQVSLISLPPEIMSGRSKNKVYWKLDSGFLFLPWWYFTFFSLVNLHWAFPSFFLHKQELKPIRKWTFLVDEKLTKDYSYMFTKLLYLDFRYAKYSRYIQWKSQQGICISERDNWASPFSKDLHGWMVKHTWIKSSSPV